MARPKKNNLTPTPPACYYSLADVNCKIESGQVTIRGNAERCALQDFGWTTNDIIDAYKKLSPKYFWKNMPSENLNIAHRVILDVYKGYINGEYIYTHFYIGGALGRLVIDSFKRL